MKREILKPIPNHGSNDLRSSTTTAWYQYGLAWYKVTLTGAKSCWWRCKIAHTSINETYTYHIASADPKSPKFGQWYSSEEIVHLFAPSQHTVNKIRGWLEEAGLKNVSQSRNKQWIQFDATTKTAEDLFKTKYYTYEHLPTAHKRMGCDEYAFLPVICSFSYFLGITFQHTLQNM